MREIKVSEVTDVIAKLCMDSCYYLPQEMMDKIRNAAVEEESPLGREILATLIENFELAKKKGCSSVSGYRSDRCISGNRPGSAFR